LHFLLFFHRRQVIRHRPGYALGLDGLLLLLAALLFTHGFFLLDKAALQLAKLSERLFRRRTDAGYVLEQRSSLAAQFFCCILNLHLGHSALAPPQIAYYQYSLLPFQVMDLSALRR